MFFFHRTDLHAKPYMTTYLDLYLQPIYSEYAQKAEILFHPTRAEAHDKHQ